MARYSTLPFELRSQILELVLHSETDEASGPRQPVALEEYIRSFVSSTDRGYESIVCNRPALYHPRSQVLLPPSSAQICSQVNGRFRDDMVATVEHLQKTTKGLHLRFDLVLLKRSPFFASTARIVPAYASRLSSLTIDAYCEFEKINVDERVNPDGVLNIFMPWIERCAFLGPSTLRFLVQLLQGLAVRIAAGQQQDLLADVCIDKVTVNLKPVQWVGPGTDSVADHSLRGQANRIHRVARTFLASASQYFKAKVFPEPPELAAYAPRTRIGTFEFAYDGKVLDVIDTVTYIYAYN